MGFRAYNVGMSKKRIGRARCLTAEAAREIVDYDPQTGFFVWKKTTASHYAGVRAGGLNERGYEIIHFDGYQVYGHHLAWLLMKGEWPENILAHRDEVNGNNQWSNIVLTSPSKNKHTTRLMKSNTSGFRGVSWHKRDQRWRASIRHLKVQIDIGRFDTAEQAAAAYQREASRLFGEPASKI